MAGFCLRLIGLCQRLAELGLLAVGRSVDDQDERR